MMVTRVYNSGHGAKGGGEMVMVNDVQQLRLVMIMAVRNAVMLVVYLPVMVPMTMVMMMVQVLGFMIVVK